MLRHRSIPSLFFRSMITMAFALLFIIGVVWCWSIYQGFQEEIAADERVYVEGEKARMQTFVDQAFAYIEYANSQAEHRLRESIQSRTENAVIQAQHLYDANKDVVPESQLKRLIIESLREQRFSQGRGYYYITAMDGEVQLLADRPELEGTNFQEQDNQDAKFISQKMIDLARKEKEGFFQYKWSKPGSEGNAHLKTAYIVYFEPFDWVIGTGEYLEDVTRDTQDEVLKWLVQIRFDDDGYLFGSIEGGEPLFTNGKITIGGNNIMGLTDPNGVKIIQEQHKVAFAQPQGGFMEYAWPMLKGESPSQKIVFVRAFPQWGWVIGSGVYLNNVQAGFEARKTELYRNMGMSLLKSAAVFLLAVTVIALASLALSKRLRKEFERITAFFSRARKENVFLDTKELPFLELQEMAESANIMIESRATAQQEREKLIQELRDNNEELERFTYTVSHDLKSPIITIKGFLGILRQDIEAGNGAKAELAISRIDKAAGLMATLLDELLSLSRIGRITNPYEDVALIDVVQEVLGQIEGVIVESGGAVDVEPNLPVLRCDRARIFEVFQNLIENAIKFVAPGQQPKVYVGLRMDGDKQVFFVRDNGIGIEPQYLNKVFGLFEQLNQRYAGTGIGLALVKSIVEHHGGQLWVESDGLGKGATFCFVLEQEVII